jgi:hypothetical protein
MVGWTGLFFDVHFERVFEAFAIIHVFTSKRMLQS